MTGRNQSDTPDFDAHVLGTVGEGGNDQGGQQQQQNDQGGSNAQPTPAPDPNAQPSAFDDVIARTDRPDPNAQQAQPDPNKQVKRPDQPKPPGSRMVDENGNDVPQQARHHFLSRKKAEKDLREARNELHTVHGQLQAFTAVHQAMQGSGLNAQEQATSLHLGAALKKDPVKAVTQLLTELKSAGINIDGAMGVSSIDTNSIAQLIDQKLAPLTGRFRQEQEQAQQEEAIVEDVHGFFEEYPQAQIHTAELNVLLQKFPDWSLDKAWSEFRVGASQNGLDLNKPLRPQIAARRANPNPRPNGGASVSMVSNGRGGTQPVRQTTTKSYDHNANIRDMVRDSLAEAGVDVSRLG